MKLLFTRNRSPFRPTTRSLRQAAPNGRSGERSISGPSRRARPASKCSGRNLEKSHSTNGLQAVHQIGSVMRSREYLLRETAFGSLDAGASAQPHPHNPRIQQENQAAAGWGERFREGKWRRRRDSNPRDGFPPTPLAGERLRPLGHVSVGGYILARHPDTRRFSSKDPFFVNVGNSTRRLVSSHWLVWDEARTETVAARLRGRCLFRRLLQPKGGGSQDKRHATANVLQQSTTRSNTGVTDEVDSVPAPLLRPVPNLLVPLVRSSTDRCQNSGNGPSRSGRQSGLAPSNTNYKEYEIKSSIHSRPATCPIRYIIYAGDQLPRQ